ncbi:MAG: nucleotidyltransferase domain-containing protein [Bacilli bacterium]|nr:nucleotidyltransferase domain-containing protein [Bacilli bacterium]
MESNIGWLEKEDLILYKSVRGSHLFGLNTPDSDLDTFGLFYCPLKWLMGTGLEYRPIISDEGHDNYYDELTKFFKELGKSNPEALCYLFAPKDKVVKWDERLKPLWDIRDSLITKAAYSSFKGYAKSQISKMYGLSKAMNIEPDEVKERKSPLYFCWVPRPGNDGVWNLEKWLRENGLKQEHCGVCRLPNGIELYTLYYDWFADKDLKWEDYQRLNQNVPESEKVNTKEKFEGAKKTTYIKYRGLLDPTNPSTQLRLSSVPKSDATNPLCTFQYNVNAFTKHCQDYKKYWDWVEHRNQKRYENNLGHQWDSKNTMHAIRIMRMGIEAATGKGLILDRAVAGDRDELLKIKAHGITFEEVKALMIKTEAQMTEAFEHSNLPDEPDREKLESILQEIRASLYGISYNTISI